MSASVVTRSSWTDDSGSGTDGTIIKNSVLQTIYDNVDLMFSGTGSYTTLTLGGKLRVEGAGLEVKGAAAPSASASGEGKVYFDSTQNRFLWSENAGTFKPFAARPYAPTVADVANTTTKTATISFTVPANEMNDGDVIEIVTSIKAKNNSGGSQNVTLEWAWGATAVTMATVAWTLSAVEQFQIIQFRMQRVGSGLWIRGLDASTRIDLQFPYLDMTSGNSNVTVLTAPTFTSSQTVALNITLGLANASFYWKTQKARILRYQG